MLARVLPVDTLAQQDFPDRKVAMSIVFLRNYFFQGSRLRRFEICIGCRIIDPW